MSKSEDLVEKMRKRQEAQGGTKPRGDQKPARGVHRASGAKPDDRKVDRHALPPFRLPAGTRFEAVFGEEVWTVTMTVPGEPFRRMTGKGVHPTITKLGQAWFKEQRKEIQEKSARVDAAKK